MALVECGECKAEVSDKAAACPKCGAPIKAAEPPKTQSVSAAQGCLFVLVLIGLVTAVGGYKTCDGNHGPKVGNGAPVMPSLRPPPPAERPPVALGVRAEKITADYSGNELSGDSKYKGKLIRVNGWVVEVSKTLSTPVIALRGNGDDNVRCFFPSNLDAGRLAEMATIKKGSLMNLDGVVRGAGVAGDVILDDCFWMYNARIMKETPELMVPRQR